MGVNVLDIERAAKQAHEAIRAYCISIGDNSQLEWDKAPAWLQGSAIAGVRFILEHPNVKPGQQHEAWMKHKQQEGWVYGSVKDETRKTHPCLVPYEQLPEAQRRKDAIFIDAVNDYFDKRAE